MQLSIVIPMYNEAANAPDLLHEIKSALDARLNYEIIVVNDGSQDNTEAVLRGLKSGMRQLRIITHQRNAGQSASLISGVRAAKAPWVATLDGDGQNDPRDILPLFENTVGIDPAREPLLIAGYRIKRNDNWIRRLSSRVANFVRQALLHDDCADTGCGLKIFPREAFMQLTHFNHLHRFLPALFRIAHGRVINVPVNHRPRLYGQSKYGVWDRLWVGITDIFGVRWLQHRSGILAADCQPTEIAPDTGESERTNRPRIASASN